MKTTTLGSSDVQVSEIGFGCMSLGNDHSHNAQILQRAFDLGVSFFDTADLYQQGNNEVTVGKAFAGMRSEVVIATKVGNRWREDGSGWDWNASESYIREAVVQSLKRLQTDYIDLYQLHGGTLEDNIDEVLATFEDLKDQGIIRAYGISSIRPNVIREYVQRAHDGKRISSNMMQYSLLDRRPEETALDLLEAEQISVIARGPVAKGILSHQAEKKLQQGFLDYQADDLKALLGKVRAFVQPGRSLAQLGLRYALAHPAVATVIPGASSMAQLEENVAAATSTLSKTEVAQLRDLTGLQKYDKHR